MGIALFQSRKYIGQYLTGFIGARKGNPFIERWMRLWLELWKDRRISCSDLHKYPLLRPLGLIVPPEQQANPRKVDMGRSGGSDLTRITDYFALNMAYERVRLPQDEKTGWDGPEYCRRHVHLLDTVDEVCKSHEMPK
ncbi:putative capsule polysaccharide biosynthesis protein [Rosellinia necatrix]|uniref:Putative capsule polysaccharide biosynthesis protein n=1 Tax=Rosellinia necatrix TaxID=77044 RepID=A0A1S8AAB4_ROSNE|nr:putative capsule polysaccharide biosynthesis protein [Rosellinia necatrix]